MTEKVLSWRKCLTCKHRKEGMCGKCVVDTIQKYGLKVTIEDEG